MDQLRKVRFPLKIKELICTAELCSLGYYGWLGSMERAENGSVLVNSARPQEQTATSPSPALGRGQSILFGDMGLGKLSLVTNATGCQCPAGLD